MRTRECVDSMHCQDRSAHDDRTKAGSRHRARLDSFDTHGDILRDLLDSGADRHGKVRAIS